ncbi:SEC-C domain-containing protein [Thermoanaerobacterium thermosaccharolyticum]|uniref:SEC-C domain-containing protein n=1 Tax=Thermoanaerobacterium thermosaccharolyticum TaxID=1517 RepID=UPI00177ACACF|nr:SEC-C domain-containing protein [Thermoanaerobacterium thermosaccharolyticum]MBE0068620.1 SEC-C domain-containing protein [Thermoanaerobacterium thermosaccharolyticum]MBE0228379.1 SEC-C domain-containing protein [Thermoanaerobacterium thermosaccharolyticum]
MKIFDISRNDDCICGSGKKYKKCCMNNIEEIKKTLTNSLSNEVNLFSDDVEFIKIVSILYGANLSEKNKSFKADKIVKLILETFETEDNYTNDDYIQFLRKMTRNIAEDKRLKKVRVPGDLLKDIEIGNELDVDNLLKEIVEENLVEEILLSIAFELQNFNFNEKEIKDLFLLIRISILDEYNTLVKVAIGATMIEIAKALEEIHAINGTKTMDKIYDIASKYPSFNEYLSSKMFDTITNDLAYVLDERIDIPFFIVYLFLLKFYHRILSSFLFDFKTPTEFYDSLFDEVLQNLLYKELIIYEKALKTILTRLELKSESINDEKVKMSFENVLSLLSLPINHWNMEIFEQIIKVNILRTLNNLPAKVEGIDKEVKLQDLISDEILDEYIVYLKKNGLEQIVDLFKKIYGDLKNTMSKISSDILANLDIKF